MIILTFSLADQEFALDVVAIREVVRIVKITPLPDSPPEVVGAIDFHATPVLILDLRLRFGLPHLPPTSISPLLLVDWHGGLLALLVDEVHGIKHIETVPEATGFLRVEDKLVSLLKLEQLPTDRTLPLLAKTTV